MPAPSPPSSRHARRPHLPTAQALYRGRAARYDQELAAFEPVRREAVQALALQPGDTVLDVGCGTGLSLPLLAEAVGPRGRVVGIEPCGEMIALARARMAGQRAVTLLEAPAAEAPLAPPRADAALFLFTHDVLQQPEALARVMAHLRPGARVVACGLRWAPWWAWPCNGWVMAAALYSTTTLAQLHAPWQWLAQAVPGLAVSSRWCGTLFVAEGRVPQDA